MLFVQVGCGGGSSPAISTSPAPVSDAFGKGADVDFASCPLARAVYEKADKTIAQAQRSVRKGNTNPATAAVIRRAMKALQQSRKACSAESHAQLSTK